MPEPTTLLLFAAYALASGSIGSWLRRRGSIAGIQRRVSATIDAALGIGTARLGERR